MDKMKFETPNLTTENVAKIAELFPGVVTERKVNFDLLRSMLGDEVYGDEAYEFTWVGKRAAIAEAGRPIRKTLRPCVEESKDWGTTENLYIEGDNLDVLKLLQESYLGKVKMVYIDPPYNTGNDFVYRDNFTQSREDYDEETGVYDEDGERLFKNTETNGRFHSDWCSMIYPRLVLARNMLRDDGVVFISINDYELDSLKKICDEVFNKRNFIATLIWDKNHSAQAGIYKVYHEYVVVYCKNIHSIGTPTSLDNALFEAGAMKKVSGRHPLTRFTFPKGTRFDAPDGFELKGEYGETEKVRVVSGRMLAQDNKLVEDVTLEAGFTQANQMRQYFYGDRESLVDSQGQKVVEFYFNSTGKIKIVKQRGVETPQTTCKFGTQGAASTELTNLFELDESPFSSPKPVAMLTDFIQRFTKENDIILDFFSGSATTAHGVFMANVNSNSKRRFILVQLQEDLDESLKQAQKDAVNTLKIAIEFLDTYNRPHLLTEIGKERIRRAGDKIKADNTDKEGIENLDIGFRVLKLDDTNMNDVYYAAGDYTQDMIAMMESNIKPNRTDMDLLFGCLLDWGLPLSMPHTHEKIDGFTVHTYNDGDLISCFEERISEKAIREIAGRCGSDKRKGLATRAVFRDSGFTSSPEKINVFEIFKLLAPNTNVRVI